MTDQTERARQALLRLVRGLAQRQGTGRAVLNLELAPELCAAALQSAAAEQDDAEISEVNFVFAPATLALSARITVRGRAWPPRPPVDTRMTLKVSDIVVSSEGPSGRLMFRVEEPLTFSSAFAETILGLLNLFFGGPGQLEALRRKGAVVTLDFGDLVLAARPDLAPMAQLVRLHTMNLDATRARLEIGFNYG